VLGCSRILELLPLAACTAPAKGAMLDMMSGTGFVSQYLGKPFDSIHAIDRMMASMSGESCISRYLECDAARTDIAELVCFKYDTIISLAGFHHLLPEGFTLCNEKQVAEYRIDCLKKWRNLLKDGGRLVLSDVPAPGQTRQSEANRATPEVEAFPDIEAILAELPPTPFGLRQDSKPEPARFFDEFVAHESISPHIAFFETESRLSSLLKRAGYTNIKTGIYFTPWYFQNPNEAAWFAHNLFGIGAERYDSPDLMAADLAVRIHHAIETHLGCWSSDDGGFWIGWKLLYASAEAKG
jgi:SAM-dependent methyltransferase